MNAKKQPRMVPITLKFNIAPPVGAKLAMEPTAVVSFSPHWFWPLCPILVHDVVQEFKEFWSLVPESSVPIRGVAPELDL